MKKLIILLSIITLAALPSMAQPGTFGFSNFYNYPIKIALGTDAASLAAATVIGTNATSVSLGAGPGQVTVQLYIALDGTVPQFSDPFSPPANFFLAGTTSNSTSLSPVAQGVFHGGNPYTIPASVDGGAFTAGRAIEYDFFAFNQDGSEMGRSDVGTNYILGGGVAPPPPAFGTADGEIGGWTITPTPEPSMIALGSLGAAALVLFRRRK